MPVCRECYLEQTELQQQRAAALKMTETSEVTYKNFSGANADGEGERGGEEDEDGEDTIKLIVSVQKSTGSSSMNNNSG